VIEATMTDRLRAGIRVGSRHYRVLGGSSSLIKEHGYYLCAAHGNITAEYIRKHIGNKYACHNLQKAPNCNPLKTNTGNKNVTLAIIFARLRWSFIIFSSEKWYGQPFL